MAKFNYRVATVDAVQLSYFNTDNTISIDYWMIDALRLPGVALRTETDWMVRKPDGTVSFYTDAEFQKEFVPAATPPSGQ